MMETNTGFKITGMEELKKNLNVLGLSQFPYAMAKGLTRTAQNIQAAEVEEMRRVFDRPTPWTLNSVYIVPAKKDNHVATVWLKDEYSVGKSGTPASKFLLPEIFGGDRNLKRFEKALQYAGVLKPGWYCVPGQAADLDAYGNIKASLVIQLISYFKGFRETGYKSNITDDRKDKLKKGTKKTRGYEYFAIRDPDNHLKPGIYKRTSFGGWGGAIKPVVMFVKKPGYQTRFDFFGVAHKVGDAMLRRNFELAIEEALEKFQ